MGLSRDQILAANDIEVEEVVVPEWKGSVYVKELSLRDRIEIENAAKGKTGDADVFYRTLIKCICDSEGHLLFDEKDIERLGAKNNKVLHKLFKKCITFNKIDAEAVEQASKN